jgi:hypothetical protein
VTTAVTVDMAGGQTGGAARFRQEAIGYLRRSGRPDVRAIGPTRRLTPVWLALREVAAARRSRRVALNNVGFFTPGGERWTLLANALHFLTDDEAAAQAPAIRAEMAKQIPFVHYAARRSDVLIAPSTAMAERIAAALPGTADRVAVRMHPVSANPVARQPEPGLILCPVIFESYKDMAGNLADWVAAVDQVMDDSVCMLVTANAAEVPAALAASRRLKFTGRLDLRELSRQWARCQAVYFPSRLEAFGFPLAEARVYGLPVIASDTPRNREIAGPALYGCTAGDLDSLRYATELALKADLAPDPAPFAPDAYFDWMFGAVDALS